MMVLLVSEPICNLRLPIGSHQGWSRSSISQVSWSLSAICCGWGTDRADAMKALSARNDRTNMTGLEGRKDEQRIKETTRDYHLFSPLPLFIVGFGRRLAGTTRLRTSQLSPRELPSVGTGSWGCSSPFLNHLSPALPRANQSV
jgi:hypothetical protein